MDTARKFANVRKRIEMMAEEMRLLSTEADEVVRETEEYHAENFASFDILDQESRIAERTATDRVCDAVSLRGSVSQLLTNFESEVRKLAEHRAFEAVG